MDNLKLWILDKDEKVKAVLQNRGTASVLLEAIHREIINGENYLEFVIPSDHDKAEYLIEENIVLYKDPDGNWNEFVIREIEDEHSDGLFKRVVCDSSSLELNDYVIRDIRPENRDAEYMLNQILQGTRWSVGNVNVPGISTRVFYNKTALECIHELAELFGGELQFRTEFVGNKIIARYVNLVQKRGTNRGKRFVYGKDIKTVKRRVDTSNLATALVGRGKGVENEEGTGYGRKLDFREVEWSVDKGDPVDKPLGQDWVGDEEALQQFGRPSPNGLVHRTRIVEFEDEEDPEVLLQKTWETLKVMKFPVISYELEVIDLESVKGHEHEAVRLGDTVTCIDKTFKPELRLDARIVELERDLLNPENTKIVMGNVQNAFKDAERNYDTEKRQQDRTIPTSWLEGYIDTLRNEIIGGSGTVRHTDDGILLLDKRPDNNPSRAILLNNGIIALSNKRNPANDPATAAGWDFSEGTFITGDGAYADQIVAGTMLADRVRGGSLYLGGVVDGIGKNGRMLLLDDQNEIVCQLDAETRGFDELFVGKISGNNVVTKNFDRVEYFVDPVNGSDNNDGKSWSTAFQSLQHAISQIPEINEGYISIDVAENSTLNEVIELTGKSGSGIVQIDLGGSTLNGFIRVASCTQRIRLRNGTVIHTGETHPEDSGPYACIRALVSNWVTVENMTLQASQKALFCAASEGANIQLINVSCYGATDSLIYGVFGAMIKVVNCSGNGPIGMKASDTTIIAGYGTQPAGANPERHTAPINGGIIQGSWTLDSGGSAPGTSVPGKKTWNATLTKSWDTVYGWNADDPKQGNGGSWSPAGTHRGLWFFNSSDIRQTLAGTNPKSIRIYLKRKSKGGYYKPVPLYFWTHNLTGVQGEMPTLSNSAGNLANFNIGEGKWVELPISYARALRDGSAKGIAIYTSNTSQNYYCVMEPTATLEITW